MWPDRLNIGRDGGGVADPDDRFDRPLDSVFELLSDRERRYVLYYLHSTDDGVASFAELADYVVARDADSLSDLEDDEAVLDRLHDTHLPELEAAGVVEYDRRSGDVWYRDHPLLERGLSLALRWEAD